MIGYVLLIWNLMVFALYGIDKRRAVARRWRVRERTLLLCAFAMGGCGALLGSILFRHKTQRPVFRVLLPLALIFNIAVVLGGMYIAARYL